MYNVTEKDRQLLDAAKSGDYSQLYSMYDPEYHSQLKQGGDNLLRYLEGDFTGVDKEDLPVAQKNIQAIKESFRQYAEGGLASGVDEYMLDKDFYSSDSNDVTTPVEPVNPGLSYTENVIPQFEKALDKTLSPVESVVDKQVADSKELIDKDKGQSDATTPVTATTTTADKADSQTKTDAASYTATQKTDELKEELEKVKTEQIEQLDPKAIVVAEELAESKVSDLNAAVGAANLITNPVQREIKDGELIDPVANATKASAFTEQIQAAEASPSQKATVRGQLEGLMQDFEGGNTPAWAAGAMRNVNAVMAQRGLGASSMAGQALVQAAMESALPIAQNDSQIFAKFQLQNLTNRQQRAMLAAEQRATFMGMEFDQAFQSRVMNATKISDIADKNFTAEQQVQLENSRAVNTMNLSNLSNRQALLMAEASALANLDTQNLTNRQQAAVQNATSFLQKDFKNLDNRQQTALFKVQEVSKALFSDQAAENASKQFNATSQSQTDQFFANLDQQNNQYNVSQENAIRQINTNAENAIKQFNSTQAQARNQFNAANSLLVAQANAQWRQTISTANTVAQNESNMAFAKAVNGMTSNNLDQIWQRERDLMQYNFESVEQGKNRGVQLLLGEQDLEELRQTVQYSEDKAGTEMFFNFLFEPFKGFFKGKL